MQVVVFPQNFGPATTMAPDVLSFSSEAVLICLFEGLRVKNFSFDRFFQGG